MSNDHSHVALECSCIKATDAACSAGGELTANMTVDANLTSVVCGEGQLLSPPEQASCIDEITAVGGTGPFYAVRLDTCNCECLNETWTAEITVTENYNVKIYSYSIFSINGCEVVLKYESSTDSVDRQVMVGDSIKLMGYCDETPPRISTAKDMRATLTALAEIENRLNAIQPLDSFLFAEGELEDGMTANYSIRQMMCSEGELNVLDTDKIKGEFGDFYCQEKLYPKADLPVDSGFGEFVGPFSETTDLWDFIDEGVYEGILKDRGDSTTLSDASGFIHPDTVHTEGLFQYKCELTNLNVRPDHTAFRMRVAAPLENYESNVAPLYTVFNIRLLDPSGNLIVKYNDITLRGDSPPGTPKFATYSSLPEINKMDEYDWERRTKPHMQMVSGYQLSFNVRAVALDDPFDPGFDEGFEENYVLPSILTDGIGNNYLALDGSPLSTQEVNFLNPTDGFKITAVEICNSGGYGPRREDYFPVYMEVPEIGKRLERCIRAQFMPLNDFDTTIWPSTNNVWADDVGSIEGSPIGVTNEDVCGAKELVNILSVPNARRFAKLQTTNLADSGKLILRFGECTTDVDEVTPGAFNFEFDQSSNKRWWSPSGAFHTENRREKIHRNDAIFYTVDTITLKVLAKKEVGSRDYVLDVVGYSEDKLLHNTSPSGGFLQNPSGICLNDLVIGSVGQHPITSGFYSENDGALGGQALSELEQYWWASGNNPGLDHYSLTQYPVVDSTDWAWYEVPLQIYDDTVRLGLSDDYSMSSYLEKIYLDIFPLPSGASIAYAELCVRYAPSNALNFYTQGGEKFGKAQDGRSEGALFPTSMGSGDDILNAGSGYGPLSEISPPHFYTSDSNIKTNYARRWRGVEGTVRGPFDPDMYGFGFENPTIDYPFLSGYYRFDNVDGLYVQSTNLGPTTPSGLGTVSGLFTTTPEIYHNIGWRYSSGTLFPGIDKGYTTTDFAGVGDPLYGKIADAFDRVVRISQDTQNINFGNVDTSGGFSVFVRFTPDVNVSGASYDLFQSGVIFSKWGSAVDLDFALAYSGGYLCGYAKDDGGNIISVADTVPFSGYQYPLNVILTYNDNESSGLKLYTDNEFVSPWSVLRASSAPFRKNATTADLVLGYSAGSGVGMNMFVSEFGISTWGSGGLYGSGTNIVETDADWTYKQVTAETFLENSRVKFFDPNETYTNDRYKLWDRVNEDTYNSWELGDFQHCQFGIGFSQWQQRPNTEHIVFDIKHSGESYAATVDSGIPITIDSGVSYHTQIENDFLRFHLSDVPDSFYAVNRRITKNVPCGYKFSDKAIVVESVISHETGYGIKWPSCEDVVPSGPRMIVSLYTKKQEPYWTTNEPNWGLVNRKVHYLMPSSCIQMLRSTFTYDDICDETEAWAIFPEEPRIKDFGERYFSDDVNDMFLQYDLVYPSGPAYESRFELHSSHVRMEDANICAVGKSGEMSLMTSGAFPADASLDLNIGGFPRDASGVLPLKMNVPLPFDILSDAPSGFVLNVSGAFVKDAVLPLFIPPQSGAAIFTLNVSGELPSGLNNTLSLALPVALGRHDSSDDTDPVTSLAGSGQFFGMPLTVFNADVAMSPDGPVLRLNTFGASGSTGVYGVTPLTLWNSFVNTTQMDGSGTVNLVMRGAAQVARRRVTGTMPLYINAPNIIDEWMPLYIHNPRVLAEGSGFLNMVTANYNADVGSAFGLWFNDNYGTGIELEDNYLATLDVSNEIRGVDLTAYGSCTGDSPSKAIDLALVTDCTVWREETCNDGGIFRAKETYTNSGAINFSGGIGYSGNYYGIRKYTQLIPSVAYTAKMTIKTGQTDAIPVPRTFEEWGYGMCGPAWDASGCCTEDCDQNLVFSGVKLIGDDAQSVAPSANMAVDSALIVASGRMEGGKYGSVVAVKGDLMAIAAPKLTIPEYDQYRTNASGDADPGPIDVSGAGAVFLYRRDTDVAGKRAPWNLIEPLMLPTGFRKDYVQRTVQNLLVFDQFSISGNKWQIGQEGREFGSSLDMAVSGDRETIVVGAPRAKWRRDFLDINTSGIPTAGMVFADLFDYNEGEIASVASVASRFNILWKYFSAPWGAGSGEWYPEINPKMVILQLTYSDKNYPVIPKDNEDWFVHRYIPRLDDLELLEDIGSGLLGGSGTLAEWIAAARPVIFDQQFSGVMDAFFTAFPSGQPTLYSGVPAIVGMFKEQTGSTAGALQYADASGNVYNIYDRFADFYVDHSSKSGVFDQLTGFAQSGHLNTVVGRSENWAQTARNLLFDTFDSGRLATTFTNTTLNRTFITSGVGQEWGDTHAGILQEFQVPPASGGRVYVFEKERDNFNCIQVIVSPNDTAELEQDFNDLWGATYGRKYNDRFGHAVGISANTEIISVGSPFTYTSCRIFERDDAENQRVYDNVLGWCQYAGKTAAKAYYGQVTLMSGVEVAKTATYDFLTSSERFEFRNDINYWGTLPTPYKPSYTYGYGDIQYIGTRQFLPQTFAGTSRLGWSTAVNDDGDVVAFGAPTDSFNEFEDANVWGDNLMRWASHVNAGAVRMFESRKYYPHSGVVEFGIFGNLDRSIHNEEREAGFYELWPTIFGSGADGNLDYQQKYWRRTDFSEIEIPRDAGLAFIITPELDAASDEIIDNIKNWLALGDRNLVLVGNDPIWEENGLYGPSNEIINKILEKLGSRMRIYPARNEEYAKIGCVDQVDINAGKYNVTKAKIPSYSTGATIGRGNYYGNGFGDIRMHLERDGLENYYEEMNCPEGATCDGGPPPIVNIRCEFPLGHEQDLRAEWTEQCIKTTPRSCTVVTYKKNWPLQFSNYTVDCDDPPEPLFAKPNQEPVPILTTAEHLPPSAWYRPATSGLFCDYRTLYEWRIRQTGSSFSYFLDNNIEEVEFNIQEDTNSDASGVYNSFSYEGDFFDPDTLNGRDGLLQGVGGSYYPEDEERQETRVIYPDSILAVVESGRKSNGDFNNSRVYIMATQWSEDDASRGIDEATQNDDKNTEFYINMVRRDGDCVQAPRGIQINGFTGRTSLENAYYLKDESETDGHGLGNKLNVEFTPGGGGFKENQEISDLNELIDFVWIAHPSGKPSATDLNELQSWLDLGGKKLIITYNAANEDTRQEIADNVNYLCSGLNVTSRPFFVPSVGEYFVTQPIIRSWQAFASSQKLNYGTDSVSGCNDGYTFTFPNYQEATSLSGLHFSDESFFTSSDPQPITGDEYNKRRFIPISGGLAWEPIVWWEDDITEQYTVYPTNRWKIDGDAVIKFPVASGSGYRMWVNWVSEKTSEKFNICGSIQGAVFDPSDEGAGGTFVDIGEGSPCGSEIDLSKTTVFSPAQSVYDFKATGDEITIRLSTSPWRTNIPENQLISGVVPATPRLLSISGCFLPIVTETVITTTSGLYPTGVEEYNCRYEVNPARSGVVPGVSRPVMHKSEIYCPPGGFGDERCDDANLGRTLIEDGPVVAAEEFENFSAFQAGRRRSKIIVISDSSMLQGVCPEYLADAIGGNQDFIRSLYPNSLGAEDTYGRDLSSGYKWPDQGGEIAVNGRNWFFSQKIRAPERGSAAKYSAISGAAVPNITSPLYGGGGGGSLSNYWDDEDTYDPTTLNRPEELKKPEEIKKRIEDFYNNDALGTHGIYPRFSGDFLNINPPDTYEPLLGYSGNELDFITDAQIGGGMSDLMKITNHDYLDLDVYYSGCLGDLFGYSIDLAGNKLVVGAPFNAFHTEGAASGVSGIVQWHEIQNDPTFAAAKIAEDGGAGAAFVFERTGSGRNVIAEFLPWEFQQKIKPSSLNVGIYDFSPSPRTALTQQRGPHDIQDPSFILEFAKRSDNFGIAVSIDCDMIAVGAPNHDYETLHDHIYSGGLQPSGLNTAFLHKSFNAEFDIPSHEYFDLGSSGVRAQYPGSGTMVLNNGAVFNYRNEIVDFQKRTQEWYMAEKLYAQGYNDRTQRQYTPDGLGGFDLSTSGTENDNFGRAVAIDRADRGDSDYVLAVGAPRHYWPTSGDHPTNGLFDAGAGYSFDAMLREQVPAIPNSGGWIEAHVFGQKKDRDATDRLETRVYQNVSGDPMTVEISGLVFSNRNGDIFLEVSGFDPSIKGFVAHRPYVEKVELTLFPPIPASSTFNLVASGSQGYASGDMNLVIVGPDRDNVYNTMNLFQNAVLGQPSGTLNMFTEAPSGHSGVLNLNLTNTQTTDSLRLRIRGY
jgi:hypothetical protein